MTAAYRVGDVLFYTAGQDDWVGLGIEAEEHSPYCHVALAVGNGQLVEAVRPKVRLAPLDVRPVAASASPPYPTDDARQAAVKAALLHVGKLYDLYGVSLLGLYTMLGPRYSHWLGKAVLMAEAGYHGPVFCSELVGLALVAGGIGLATDVHLCKPSDIAHALGVA